MTEKMIEALNIQINKEIYSAYLYVSMSAYSEHLGLRGFANWFMVQYREEIEHAMRIYLYLVGQGGRIKLLPRQHDCKGAQSPAGVFELFG